MPSSFIDHLFIRHPDDLERPGIQWDMTEDFFIRGFLDKIEAVFSMEEIKRHPVISLQSNFVGRIIPITTGDLTRVPASLIPVMPPGAVKTL